MHEFAANGFDPRDVGLTHSALLRLPFGDGQARTRLVLVAYVTESAGPCRADLSATSLYTINSMNQSTSTHFTLATLVCRAFDQTWMFAKHHLVVNLAVLSLVYALGVAGTPLVARVFGKEVNWDDPFPWVAGVAAVGILLIGVFVFHLWRVPFQACRELSISYADVQAQLAAAIARPPLTEDAREILAHAHAGGDRIYIVEAFQTPRHIRAGRHDFCSDTDASVAPRYIVAFETEIQCRGWTKETSKGVHLLYGDGLKEAMLLKKPGSMKQDSLNNALGLSPLAADILLKAFRADHRIRFKYPEAVPTRAGSAARLLIVAGESLFPIDNGLESKRCESACVELQGREYLRVHIDGGWELTENGVRDAQLMVRQEDK